MKKESSTYLRIARTCTGAHERPRAHVKPARPPDPTPNPAYIRRARPVRSHTADDPDAKREQPPAHAQPTPRARSRPPSAPAARLQAATAAAGLPAGRVRGNGRHVLDAADLEPGARQGAEGVLSAGAGGLGLVAARCPHLDVHGRDAELL